MPRGNHRRAVCNYGDGYWFGIGNRAAVIRCSGAQAVMTLRDIVPGKSVRVRRRFAKLRVATKKLNPRDAAIAIRRIRFYDDIRARAEGGIVNRI